MPDRKFASVRTPGLLRILRCRDSQAHAREYVSGCMRYHNRTSTIHTFAHAHASIRFLLASGRSQNTTRACLFLLAYVLFFELGLLIFLPTLLGLLAIVSPTHACIRLPLCPACDTATGAGESNIRQAVESHALLATNASPCVITLPSLLTTVSPIHASIRPPL